MKEEKKVKPKKKKKSEEEKDAKSKNSRYYIVSNAKAVFDEYYKANDWRYETLSDFYEELGEYCGVSPSTIGQMRLKGLPPSVIAGQKIAEFLGVDFSDIWKIVEKEDYEERPRCIVEGCNRVGTTKGLCMRHVYISKELNEGRNLSNHEFK